MATNFESFMMQCLRAREDRLRIWLKKQLIEHGFTIQEDSYVSSRAKKQGHYKKVHNMLAIRGEDPKVCLVAHTDVCRDHDRKSEYDPKKDTYTLKSYNGFLSKSSDKEDNREYKVEPVERFVKGKNGIRKIIQDKNCAIQVGGDDRLGVAINAHIALNTTYPMGLLFTTDEECGLVSAREVKFPELKKFELLCQVDRGNHTDELVTKIHNEVLADYETVVKLLKVAHKMGMPRKPVNGGGTDVYAIKSNKMCKNAVNMTCGYHNSISDDGDEFIDIEEAKNTERYVHEIIKSYFLGDEYLNAELVEGIEVEEIECKEEAEETEEAEENINLIKEAHSNME